MGLIQAMETGSPAAKDLALWKERLASGRRRFSELAAGGGTFPALFVWLVDASGTYASAFALAAAVSGFGAVVWLVFGTGRRVLD